MISFCITCMNRLYQLKNTLPINLEDNSSDNVEFILVDFNSSDGLKDYILKNYSNELKSGYLKYYFTDELNYWHTSIAKNTAHMLAKGDYVVNLDCDNYTGKYGGTKLLEIHRDNPNSIIHQTNYMIGSGNCGRISLSKKNFLLLGGYDESFYQCGYNDPDLIDRAEKIGLKYIGWNNINYNRSIPNSKKDTIKNCNSKLTWEEMNKFNKILSKFNIEKKEYVANKHKKYIGIIL
uniref:Glycosyltransferase 2-like domain-containing protein n=1 Tax=Megaviridae environmental sample TaxID=1737588 RepID=A0A5J6VK80_9VIRU|nr:MAG: hypothetical protein [Megaviridae environmental sample]